jgi:hypothetical protein
MSQAADAPGTLSTSREAPLAHPPATAWRRFGTGAGVLGAEGAAGYLHPALGITLAAVDAIVPLIVAVILLAAILRGSSQTAERVFRLLRWVTNRPEPPAPPVG